MDFNKFYKISVTAMRFNRTHPHVPRDLKWLLQFILMHGVATFVFFLVVYSTIFHDLKTKNYTQICENSVIMVLFLVLTFCYCMMLWNQDSLKYIINAMQRDYVVAKSLNIAEQDMLLDYAMRGVWNSKLWLCIAGGVSLLFPLRSMSLMLYYTITDEFRKVPLYDLTYPAILEESRYNLVSFISIYATMLWFCVYAMTMYVGMVPLGPIFMLHSCGQLELVKNKADVLFKDYRYDSKKTQKKLKEIAQQLQDIYCFVEEVQKSFKLIYELCLKGTTVTMPLLIYELSETLKHGELNMEFLTITFGSIVISSTPCFYGDLLMERGNSLRQALYCSGWERHWDKRVRLTLLMILLRSGRPVALHSMFAEMCLGALANVFHHSYTIYNLINAMW